MTLSLILLFAMMGQQGTTAPTAKTGYDMFYIDAASDGCWRLVINNGPPQHIRLENGELWCKPVPAHPDRKKVWPPCIAGGGIVDGVKVPTCPGGGIDVSPKEQAPQIIKIDVPATCTIVTDSTQDQSEIHLQIRCDKGNESRKR